MYLRITHCRERGWNYLQAHLAEARQCYKKKGAYPCLAVLELKWARYLAGIFLGGSRHEVTQAVMEATSYIPMLAGPMVRAANITAQCNIISGVLNPKFICFCYAKEYAQDESIPVALYLVFFTICNCLEFTVLYIVTVSTRC